MKFKLFDFLKQPVITDKTTKLIEQKQYTFDVAPQLTKQQIKHAFEKYYQTQIKSVRTYRILKKKNYKKRVIICLNQEIPIFQSKLKRKLRHEKK